MYRVINTNLCPPPISYTHASAIPSQTFLDHSSSRRRGLLNLRIRAGAKKACKALDISDQRKAYTSKGNRLGDLECPEVDIGGGITRPGCCLREGDTTLDGKGKSREGQCLMETERAGSLLGEDKKCRCHSECESGGCYRNYHLNRPSELRCTKPKYIEGQCKTDSQCKVTKCCVLEKTKYPWYQIGDFYAKYTTCATSASKGLPGGATCKCHGECKSGQCELTLPEGSGKAGETTLKCTAPPIPFREKGSFCDSDEGCISKCCDEDNNVCAAPSPEQKTANGAECVCNSQCHSEICEKRTLRTSICKRAASQTDADIAEYKRMAEPKVGVRGTPAKPTPANEAETDKEKKDIANITALWATRNDLKLYGAAGQSCVSKHGRAMGTAPCPGGQRCGSADKCEPDWEKQRYSFGIWKGAMLTDEEQTSGNYGTGLHKGCITKTCSKVKKKKKEIWYAPRSKQGGGWWRSETTAREAITDGGQEPGWVMKGSGYIVFGRLPTLPWDKLMPGQFCGDEKTCKTFCVDPTNHDGGYCWEILKPHTCRPDVLPACRPGLECLGGFNGIPKKCVNATSADGKDLNALKEKQEEMRALSFEEDPAVCARECRSRQPCTGSNSNGIQKLTSFNRSTADALPEIMAGDFASIPTPLKDVAVFGTGQCYECLLGADQKFRCPVHGRRKRLLDHSVVLKGFKGLSPGQDLEKRRALAAKAVDMALYVGPDMCFNHKEALARPGFAKGPYRMLQDLTEQVSLRCN